MTTPPLESCRTSPSHAVEAEILRVAREAPELGQAAVAERMRALGLRVSPSGVRYIWQRHGLETAVKRLQALAESSDRGLASLTERQRRQVERGRLSARLAQAATQDNTGDAPPERARIILDAAAELFSARGYDRTSMRDIAHQAGLLPGSVYHHFASKEDLYVAVQQEGLRIVAARVRAAAAGGRDPWERLRLACEVHVTGLVEGTPVDRLTGHNLAMIGDQAMLERIQPFRETYEQLFREFIDALPLAADTDRRLLRLMLLGAMNWVHIWYREGSRSPRDIADRMVDMLRYGVSARAEA
ncbi:MAG TPA: TetR family transcriptional regulator [Azoarcus taiwanensis]|nr:TetR family transcriptional regulator [Azoarcus taiwanensis]